MFTPGHYGRACPIETPEGPNIGRVLVVARGATIREGRLEIVDNRPEMTLGLCASLIPFLEHDEPCRALMGANMLRQWITPSDPEPPLVGTGNEPDDPNFWSGHNLVTAYVPWGLDSFEDSIALSETCAQRLATPKPIQVGDKLGNRHGAKGVVSRILPDAEMPHLPDGTCVDLVYDCMGLYSRLNFGQVREALMGRIAQREGVPAVVPPFAAPSEAELKARLQSGRTAGRRHGTADGGQRRSAAGAPGDRRRGLLGTSDPYRRAGLFRLDAAGGLSAAGRAGGLCAAQHRARPRICGSIFICAPPKRTEAATLAERVRSGAPLDFPFAFATVRGTDAPSGRRRYPG